MVKCKLKIQKGIDPPININLPNYQYLQTPKETTKGGTLKAENIHI